MQLSQWDSVSADSIVVLIHDGLKVCLKFGARWLNLGSHFRKWIQSISDITVVNFGLKRYQGSSPQKQEKRNPVRVLLDIYCPLKNEQEGWLLLPLRCVPHTRFRRTTTYKHDFDIYFFPFFGGKNFVPVQQSKDLHVGCRNVSINLYSKRDFNIDKREQWKLSSMRKGCFRRSNSTSTLCSTLKNSCTYIVFIHGTNLSHPVAPTLEFLPIHFASIRTQRLFDSINSRMDHHLPKIFDKKRE